MSQEDAYRRAGVDIAAGKQATDMMAAAVRATYGPQVLSHMGSFGGLYDAAELNAMEQPVLVASTDGVGTKTKVAARLGQWETIGRDLVNHCINDILVQGAHPLFFLDYVASSHLDPQQVATIVGSMAAACQEASCALLGGETAEMPGVYEQGELDLVGTIVGVVRRSHIITGARIKPGDFLIGLPSSGLHTNGYSLARRVLDSLDWSKPLPELGTTPGEALLAVHCSYLEPVQRWFSQGVDVRGLAHITGGGLIDNLPRVLPEGVSAMLYRGSWACPPIFELIQREGGVSEQEMFHVFNMGLGMVAIVPGEDVTPALASVDGRATVVGEIVQGDTGVVIR